MAIRCGFCHHTVLLCPLKEGEGARDVASPHCEHFDPYEEIRYENDRFMNSCGVCRHADIRCTSHDCSRKFPTEGESYCFDEFTYRW